MGHWVTEAILRTVRGASVSERQENSGCRRKRDRPAKSCEKLPGGASTRPTGGPAQWGGDSRVEGFSGALRRPGGQKGGAARMALERGPRPGVPQVVSVIIISSTPCQCPGCPC